MHEGTTTMLLTVGRVGSGAALLPEYKLHNACTVWGVACSGNSHSMTAVSCGCVIHLLLLLLLLPLPVSSVSYFAYILKARSKRRGARRPWYGCCSRSHIRCASMDFVGLVPWLCHR